MRGIFTLALLTMLCLPYSALAWTNPWTEADGPDVIFLATRNMTCGDVSYTVWTPYNTKLNKQLDFLRVVANGEHRGGKITMQGDDFFIDGKRCLPAPPRRNVKERGCIPDIAGHPHPDNLPICE